MKTWISVFVFSSILSLSLHGEDTNKLSLSVPDMTCPSCAASVEKELKKIDGISDIEISIGSKSVVVTISHGKKVTNAQLDSAIKLAGFEVKR